MVNKIVNVSKLLLTNILSSPGYHFSRGLYEVIYLYLHQDHYLNCSSAFMKVFVGKQFSPRELLSAPWITIGSGIIKIGAIVVIITYAG